MKTEASGRWSHNHTFDWQFRMIRHVVLGVVLCLIQAAAVALPAASTRDQDPQHEGTGTAGSQTGPDTRAPAQDPAAAGTAPRAASPEPAWKRYLKSLDRQGLSSIEDINYRGFYPRVAWISTGSGPALGVRYWKPSAIGSLDVLGSAYYSWRRYQFYDLQLGLIPHRGETIPPDSFATEGVDQLGDVDRQGFSRLKLYGTVRFRDRTDDSFYGLGPDSQRSARLRYRVKDSLGELATGYQFSDHFGFTVKAGYLENSLACGRSTPTLCANLPTPVPSGTPSPPHYFRFRSNALFDYRDDFGLPHKGLLWAIGWDKWDNVNAGNRFNFNLFATDLRGYVPLGGRAHTLALRGVAIYTDPAAGNRVPFFLQPSLGGGDTLRGYDPFRFQGDKLMLAQAEYRWEASRWLELALFGDTGTVAVQGSRLSVDKLKSDWGFGFRFKTAHSILLRIDEAFSNEGAHTQVRLAAAF
ncbi:MAG: BamA/TamA family outer membrane protein [Acidobacteriota bacterium]